MVNSNYTYSYSNHSNILAIHILNQIKKRQKNKKNQTKQIRILLSLFLVTMKKLSSRRSSIRSKSLKQRLILLCKIFVIWLLLQFFLQTFVTFKLGRDGTFWTLFWMWKEFILLIFLVSIIRYISANIKKRIKAIKNKENTKNVNRSMILKNIKWKFIIQIQGRRLLARIQSL